jgi:hypothetical protein
MNSTNDSQAAAGKMMAVWLSTMAGMSIADWAALCAVVYTALQILVLLRDKFGLFGRKGKK